VSQYLVDDLLILDAGDHPGFTSTLWADRDIDVKYPFQALCPGHGLVPLFGCFVFVFLVGTALATFSRRHSYPVFAVGHDKIVWNDFEQLQLARRVEGRMPGIIRHGTGSGLLSVSAPGQPAWQ